MNEDIYNPKVAEFEQKILKLQRDILDGTFKIETTFQLDLLFEKIESIWKEYEYIYNEIENPISKKALLGYLNEETEFLKILTSLVNNLQHYRHVVGDFIETSVLENIWNDVKTILTCNHKLNNYYKGVFSTMQKSAKTMQNNMLYKQEFEALFDTIDVTKKETQEAVNRIEELTNATERNDILEIYKEDSKKVKEKIEKKQEEIENFAQEVIPAIDRLYDVLDGSELAFEIEKTNFKEENRENVLIDKQYLETLSLTTEKIDYIKLVMENILKQNGKKQRIKCNGKMISVPKKYVGRFNWCQTELYKFQKQYEQEIMAMVDLDENNLKKEQEEYATIYVQFKEVNDRLLSLAEKAKPYSNTNQVVAVASLNKEPLYVMKNSLNRFNNYFMEYKRLQKELTRFSERHNIKVPVIENMDTVENLEKELYNQIYKLKDRKLQLEVQKEDTSTIELEIKKKQDKLYQMNKGKQFTIFANLKVLFKSALLVGDISNFYTEVVKNPENLLKNPNYTDKEKRSILNEIYTKMDRCIQNAKDNKICVQNFLQNQVNNVKRRINILPKLSKNTFKITDIRDAKNKNAFKVAVATASVVAVAVVGIQGLSNLSTTSQMEIEKNIEMNSEEYVLASNPNVSPMTKEVIFSSAEENMEKSNIHHVKELFKEEQKKENTFVVETLEKKIIDQNEIVTPKEKENTYEKIFENNYVDFGETFEINKPEIYANYLDAANEENVLKASNDLDSKRVVDGITYEYNGEYIFISSHDEDAEAKKSALEANGAVQVNYRGANENGWEGYFADENVTFTNEGRGR